MRNQIFILVCMILLQCCDREIPEKLPVEVDFDGVEINAIIKTNTEGLWIGGSNGLFYYNSGEWYEYSEEIGSKVILDITLFQEDLWLGTTDGLICATIDDDKRLSIREVFDDANSCLKSNRIQVLEVSPEGHLWVGASEGVCYFDGNSWKDDLDAAIRVLNASSFAFGETDYYIGTYGDYLHHYYVETIDASSGASYLIPPFNGDLSTDTVFCTRLDEEGSLWFGSTTGLTKNYGGTHVIEGSFQYYLEEIPVIELTIESGIVYAGTNEGLHIFDGEQWTNVTTGDGLPHNTVKAVCVVSQDDIWIGTKMGLIRL